MKTILYKADSRGHANHGWLDTHHSFSFASYHNPERMNFGALRVFNDDKVAGGMGFGQHPHRDMEIITIPFKGALKHGDNMGNSGIIRKGQIQIMSAGTGVVHSEVNAHPSEAVEFLQIWIMPNKQSVTPRYAEADLSEIIQRNAISEIISPEKTDSGLWIHQDAWVYLGNLDSGMSATYQLNTKGNGIFLFGLEGGLKVGEQILSRRDALGITDFNSLDIRASENSEFIIIEVPMTF